MDEGSERVTAQGRTGVPAGTEEKEMRNCGTSVRIPKGSGSRWRSRRLALAVAGTLLAGGVAAAFAHGSGGLGSGGPGMMMGPGMMGPWGGQGWGPGMMGPWGGQGWGPGMMAPWGGFGPGGGHGPMMGFRGDRDTIAPGAGQPDGDLTAEEVRARLENWLARMGNPRLEVGDVREVDKDTIIADIVTKKGKALVDRFRIDRHSGAMQRSG